MDFREILKQAERGVHQAPTLAGYRHPLIKGWKELATTSSDKIREMAANGYSGCDWVSVAKDGFACIIDIDDVEFAKSIGMPIPWHTFMVNTPSGGLHVYLWHSDESVKLGNTNIMGSDGTPAVEFKANNLTCASPGVLRSDKQPHGYYGPANANEIQPITKELVEFLRRHGRQKKQYAASAPKREFHPSYELEDEIEHQGWSMTGEEKIGSDGVRYIEFAACPIDEEVHAGMENPGNFKCCLTVGDYGIGFDCKAGRHQDLTIADAWEACETRGIEPYPYCRYLDEDKNLEAKTLAETFGAETADTEVQGNDARPESTANTDRPASTVSLDGFTYEEQDTGNGERIVQKFGRLIRWVSETNEWMVWGEKGWRKDTTGTLMRMTKSVLRNLFDEAHEGEKVDLAKLKHALTSGRVERRKAMINSAGFEKEVFTNINDWDADGWLLNVDNGIIDLRTQIFRERTPSDLCMKQSPVKYDPSATCPLWEAAMNKWMCGDQSLIEYVQTALGVALTSDTRVQALFFNQGDGENGKDTAFGVIAHVMGTYWQNVNFMTFAETKNHSEHRNDLASLAGAVRMVTSCESSDGHSLDEGVIKQVTGCSPVTCRQILGKPFTYMPQYKMWFMSNYEPVIKGNDWGIWRRVKKIPWNYTIKPEEKDPNFVEKLKAEAPGILNWMLAGLRKYIALGCKLPPCKAVEDATAQYRKDMDIVGRFASERLAIQPTATALGAEIYRVYVEWCRANGHLPLGSRRFFTEFKKRYAGKIKWRDANKGVLYEGVGMTVDGVYPTVEMI
jgi:P4 family phage/plasmid primase-like protien